ncbi:hypothetical protein, partial [Thermus sp.]|uniref:hypothetical protein n=1 Tax=Thermus sp. TaxID=275 RepID=UPI003D14E666
MKTVLVFFKNNKIMRRVKRFPDWKTYERFLEGLARGRWARVYNPEGARGSDNAPHLNGGIHGSGSTWWPPGATPRTALTWGR